MEMGMAGLAGPAGGDDGGTELLERVTRGLVGRGLESRMKRVQD